MSESNALTDLGGLSKPATTLIEKVHLALAGVFKPRQIRRVAEAEADAALIAARADLEITALQRRAMERFVAEEARKQDNIETITKKCLPLLNEDAAPEDLEDDWITHFFEHCRGVSSDEGQQLWARLLAGEANSPSSFSRRTVNLLSNFDPDDAAIFTTFCRFLWRGGAWIAVFHDLDNEIYRSHGINFEVLSHLQSLGLIRVDKVTGFRREPFLTGLSTLCYAGHTIGLRPNDNKTQIPFGQVLLTRTGDELARLCQTSPIPGYLQLIKAYWHRAGLSVSDDLEPQSATSTTRGPDADDSDDSPDFQTAVFQ